MIYCKTAGFSLRSIFRDEESQLVLQIVISVTTNREYQRDWAHWLLNIPVSVGWGLRGASSVRRSARDNMFFVVFLTLLSPAVSELPKPYGVTVVVLGSTGDLAKRYIWPALFETFLADVTHSNGCTITAFYAATKEPANDEKGILDIITSNADCSRHSGVSDCLEKLSLFRSLIQVVRLDHTESYASFATVINHSSSLNGIEEVGRIFYLAVPPFVYPSIVEKISNHLRPLSNNSWIRVVLEKPFGYDFHSAQKLSKDLINVLTSDELYLVDHYLGKVGMQGILPFRQRNSQFLESVWNRNWIQSIEISLIERLGVEGRSLFYDRYGVIRDVMQSHLTELLVHAAVSLHSLDNMTTDYLSAKNDLLSKVYSPSLQNTLLGQYSGYLAHLAEDGVVPSMGNESQTPTFAAVALHLRDPDWIGVRFLLISGKQLHERSAYVRVVFRKNQFIMAGSGQECVSSILFLIQSEALSHPGILISTDLAHLQLVAPTENWVEDDTMYEDCPYIYLHPQNDGSPNAYVSLIRDVLNGNKQNFVDITSLLHSWNIWSPLLSEIQLRRPVLHSYDSASIGTLAFKMKGTQVIPLLQADTNWNTLLHTVSSRNYIGRHRINVVTGTPAEVSSVVAHYLSRMAKETVRDKGYFHIAFPGGSSPVGLFQSLVLDNQHTIPWRHIHVWMTDERCVHRNSSHSNILQLSNHLLALLPIPITNIHPMPILLHSGYCIHTDSGTELYESELEYQTCGKIDLVILGLGSDGHVASLFPKPAVDWEMGNGVKIVQLVSSYQVHSSRRMTLSLDTILNSRKIVLLVSEEEKESVFTTLVDCLEDNVNSTECELPVVKLAGRVQYDQLTIYRSL